MPYQRATETHVHIVLPYTAYTLEAIVKDGLYMQIGRHV